MYKINKCMNSYDLEAKYDKMIQNQSKNSQIKIIEQLRNVKNKLIQKMNEQNKWNKGFTIQQMLNKNRQIKKLTNQLDLKIQELMSLTKNQKDKMYQENMIKYCKHTQQNPEVFYLIQSIRKKFLKLFQYLQEEFIKSNLFLKEYNFQSDIYNFLQHGEYQDVNILEKLVDISSLAILKLKYDLHENIQKLDQMKTQIQLLKHEKKQMVVKISELNSQVQNITQILKESENFRIKIVNKHNQILKKLDTNQIIKTKEQLQIQNQALIIKNYELETKLSDLISQSVNDKLILVEKYKLLYDSLKKIQLTSGTIPEKLRQLTSINGYYQQSFGDLMLITINKV